MTGGNVEKQDCSRKYISSRVLSYSGDRRAGTGGAVRKCEIKLEKVSMEDAGIWQCELEEYVAGDHVRGRKVSQYMQLTVTGPKTGSKNEQWPKIVGAIILLLQLYHLQLYQLPILYIQPMATKMHCRCLLKLHHLLEL